MLFTRAAATARLLFFYSETKNGRKCNISTTVFCLQSENQSLMATFMALPCDQETAHAISASPLPSPPALQISIKEAIRHHPCILYRPNLLKLMPPAASTRGLAADRWELHPPQLTRRCWKSQIDSSSGVWIPSREPSSLSRLGSQVTFCILMDLVLLRRRRLKFWTTRHQLLAFVLYLRWGCRLHKGCMWNCGLLMYKPKK